MLEAGKNSESLKPTLLSEESLKQLDALMSQREATDTGGEADKEEKALDQTFSQEQKEGVQTADGAMNGQIGYKGGHLIGNSEAEAHFHSHFQVHQNVLSRTKETLERYLVKRIAQLNSDQRALSTSKQSDMIDNKHKLLYGGGFNYSSFDSKIVQLDGSMGPVLSSRDPSLLGAPLHGQRPRYGSNIRHIPSRTLKRGDDLKLYNLMHRSKKNGRHRIAPDDWAAVKPHQSYMMSYSYNSQTNSVIAYV